MRSGRGGGRNIAIPVTMGLKPHVGIMDLLRDDPEIAW
jgi:hypothetical protein